MAGRTAYEAVNNFLEPLHKVVSCVTEAQLDVKGGYYPTTNGEPHALTLADGLPQKLSGEANLSLVVKQFYYVLKHPKPQPENKTPWQVSTAEYNYNLRDSDNRVVIAFHWHPADRFKVRRPHLHLEQGAMVGRPDLHRVHVPTNRVLVEDVVQFAIDELKIRPRRDDWKQVLTEGRARFRAEHNWGSDWEGELP